MKRQSPQDQADLLARTGRWIYGENFRGSMAQELAVDERTLRRWIGAQAPIPGGIWADLAKIIDNHKIALNQAQWHLNHHMLLATVEPDDVMIF